MSQTKTIDAIMELAPVIPVLVIKEAAYARPIAEALVAGGLYALEGNGVVNSVRF
jgi:2-dehydro-3-deoxyphosphogluconate aldolase / (4S)-4-hydroxy-2-oxoglutarate aldolase